MTKKNNLAAVKKIDGVAEIVDFVKQNIIFGRMRPRERLIEEELTVRFGASRHVARAAMVELEQMGIVTRRPNKGAVVRDFSVDEIEQIYNVRGFLQAEAIRLIKMPLSTVFLSELQKIHDQYCAAYDRQELQEVCKINNKFHHRIWMECGNDVLVSLIDRIWTESLGIRCYGIGDPNLLSIARDEHGQMIDLLRDGDRDGFLKLSIEHMQPALEAYKRAHGGWTALALNF
jgi:DNA-binding GntR family transcriptional regulator